MCGKPHENSVELTLVVVSQLLTRKDGNFGTVWAAKRVRIAT
jgi:hypothetical protein